MKKICSICVLLFLCIVGCTPSKSKIEKFEAFVDRRNIHQTIPIQLIFPQNAGQIEIESLNGYGLRRPKLKFDLDIAYSILSELLQNELYLDSNSNKWMKIKIDKVQTEFWGLIVGSYMYFTVETSTKLIKSFKVQDQSGTSVYRAASGAISRGVETILKDRLIQNFLSEE